MRKSSTTWRPGVRSTLGFPLVVAVALSACSVQEADLDRPSYVWEHESGFCGGTLAVDSGGGVWNEGGCESSSSFSQSGSVPSDQLARIAAAFAAHPDPSSFSDPGCSEDRTDPPLDSVIFRERRPDGTTREWRICVAQWTDLDAYPTPFSATAHAFPN